MSRVRSQVQPLAPWFRRVALGAWFVTYALGAQAAPRSAATSPNKPAPAVKSASPAKAASSSPSQSSTKAASSRPSASPAKAASSSKGSDRGASAHKSAPGAAVRADKGPSPDRASDRRSSAAAHAAHGEQAVRAEAGARGAHNDEPSEREMSQALARAAAQRKGERIALAAASARAVATAAGDGGGLVRASVQRAPKGSVEADASKAFGRKGSAREGGKKTKNKPESVCLAPAVEIRRGQETESIALTRCDGQAHELGVLQLSVLGRPGSVHRPTSLRTEADLGTAIRKLDARLIERVAKVAAHFGKDGKPAALEIISGYRPSAKGSQHGHGRALDLRVRGVRNEQVVAFCKTLDDSGCGYYPNAGFVHVDARDPGTGHISWIDASGSGEPARYVSAWPEAGGAGAAGAAGKVAASVAPTDGSGVDASARPSTPSGAASVAPPVASSAASIAASPEPAPSTSAVAAGPAPEAAPSARSQVDGEMLPMLPPVAKVDSPAEP